MNSQALIAGTSNSQRGLTLIEVMVAMTISLLLLGGVMQVFTSNKQTYRLNEALSRLQESGRYALNHLTQEIRMADFWGCKGNIGIVNSHLNAGAGNPFDLLAGGLSGTDNAGLNGSDTLVLQGATDTGITINAHNVNSAQFTTVVNSGLNDFDFVLATDCEKADLMQVTSTQPSTSTVTANTGAGTPGNATKPGLQYQGDATLFKTQQVTYSVQAGASGEPALFYSENGTNQELVEGVEDLQITYGEDTDGDGAANRYLAAGAAGLDMARVISVRVVLTLRTREDNLTSVTANGDNRIRRTFSATTVMRNRLT